MCAKKKCKPDPFCFALPSSFPPPLPAPCPPVRDVVCSSLGGNILLGDPVTTLEIWKGEISREATVTISVFNSSISTSAMKVTITRNDGSPVEFTVPSRNTLSATVDHAKSIAVSREGMGIVEGKYCLEVCFAASL